MHGVDGVNHELEEAMAKLGGLRGPPAGARRGRGSCRRVGANRRLAGRRCVAMLLKKMNFNNM